MNAAIFAPKLCCRQHPTSKGIPLRSHKVSLNATAPPNSKHAATALRRRSTTERRRQALDSGLGAAASAAASTDASDGSGNTSTAPAASGGRHAFLHDFCMCLPYGALLLAGGLVAKLFGWGQPAVVLMVLGALQLVLSNLSLKAWRGGKPTTFITLSEAGLAGWLAYYAYRAVQQGVSGMLMGAVLGLSAAMALFLLYNVAAGGNPPRRGTHAAAAVTPAPETAAAN